MEKKHVRLDSKRTRDMIFFGCLVALPLLHFFIFYICINFNSILLAFKRYDTNTTYTWVNFENFKTLFVEFKTMTAYRYAFKNSLIFFVIGTTVATTLALFFSYYIYKQAPMKNFFKVLLFMPSIIPVIAMSTIFKQFADSAIPSLYKILFGTKIQGLIQNPQTTMGAILFYNIWVSFGINLLMYLGAMNGISESLVEAAKLDGVTFFGEFIYITFPSIFSTFRSLLIVSIGGIFTNQARLLSFFGTTQAEETNYTIGYYLYIETVANTLNNINTGLPKLSAFGLLLTAVTLPFVFGTNWLMKRIGPKTED